MLKLVTTPATPEIRQAAWTHEIERSALQDLLAEATPPAILSLALGLPAAELFPAAAFAQAAQRLLSTDERALQYGPPSAALKRQIVSLMKRRGVACREAQVFLTTGAQQGLSLLTRLLLDPVGQVLTEELVYPGFQQALQPFRAVCLTVPTDLRTGMDVDAVESLLRTGQHPSLIYVVADGHNPLGVSMSRDSRLRLTELARRYGVPIIEDDPYGFLSYDGEPAPPLRAFDERWVFYVGSFSKIFAPALRVGWLVVPEELTPNLAILKESSDIDTATFTQRALAVYLETGALDAHLSMLRDAYRARRDAMICALEQHLPPAARWHVPAAGVFVWVELPGPVDTGELFKVAIRQEGVAFVPGCAFRVGESSCADASLRLNFSNSSPALIEDGVARIARALKRM
ncbi:MAG: PLP-dependent aminotransferase family protein [Acidobacteria bacterium]|nr:PLP-dependent aminotransferase family protein [Acidobacteriota bacterium]